ncbi:MAG: hypothetical protein SF187_12260 [Deltaproteobacteria bacterium]|nr:hypothetical protein [Deltaproteobacteria bacterium]
MTEPPFTIPLDEAHIATGFRGGKPSLDFYFAKHALPNHRERVGVTYVLPRDADDPNDLPLVLGFYTLSMAQLQSALAAPLVQAKLPRYRSAGLLSRSRHRAGCWSNTGIRPL